MERTIHKCLPFIWPLVLAWAGVACNDSGVADRAAARKTVHKPPSVVIRGEGATFPYPIYSRWALAHHKQTGLRLDYARSGSRAGVAAIKAGRVDFGASDIPLSPEDQGRLDLLQFPMVIGAAVPVVNLPGVRAGALRMDAELLAGIYLGRIRRWNDPALRAANPGLTLPDAEIVPIQRDDASGTRWLFDRFLRSASGTWRAALAGKGKDSKPVGVPARDNGQVARFVKQFTHTIAYIELSQALASGLCWARLKNRAGRHVAPDLAAIQSAAQHGSWGKGSSLQVSLVDAPGAASWPITGASYVLVRRNPRSGQRTTRMLRYFHWALTGGANMAHKLRFVTLPRRVVERIEDAWSRQIRADGAQVWGGDTSGQLSSLGRAARVGL